MKNRHQKGQSLVIIALAFLALVAVAALVIDGGIIYLNRRRVQTAADAAALAGARELCVGKGSDTAIQNIASQYAITENGATAVESVTIDRANDAVAVTTRLETSSFFAQVLGREENSVRADASAACFIPGTMENLLPIAWTCRPPVGGSVEDECSLHSIPWEVFDNDLLPRLKTNANLILDEGDGATWTSYTDGTGGKIPYIVMDDDKFSVTTDCEELNPAGQINCDFNDDGILEVEGGSDRGWLSLDGSQAANNLSQWMLNGYPNPITIPHWFLGKHGVATSVFINAHAIRYKLKALPVFNAICPDTKKGDLPADCPTEYQPGDLITGPNGSGKNTFYRVAGFAPFVVTCVSKGNSEPCPVKDNLANVQDKVKTIEGYFVDGYVAGTGIDPDGSDLGVYIISLTP